MIRYIISPEAIQDLDNIFDYFSNRNIEARERFVNAFEKKCHHLVNFPNIGRSYAEIIPSLRGVPIDGYIILYRTSQNNIEILRVVSGYRDLEALFSPSDDT